MPTAEELIRHFNLQPHPKEGGFFRETYRSDEAHSARALPSRYGADRVVSTAIYYMLTPGTKSALHRLKSDEIFHFYLGGPVRMLWLLPDGTGKTLTLGPDVTRGQLVQVVVPRGVWQGSHLLDGDFALLGCTVAPGFDYADYEHGEQATLAAQYPEHAEMIRRLT